MAAAVVAFLVAVLIALLAKPRPAAAWTFREHEEIGSRAYVDACRALAQKLADRTDEALRARLDMACRNVDVAAVLYGKANGTAGDRISDPEEFLSSIGAFRATSRLHYLRLKIVNSDHFHPKTARQWRHFHRSALDRAVRASALAGVDQIDAFELAVYANAFADHFLQDAFCSGHMGFNRPASSASASLVFHETWNRRGRTVRNRDGASWRTYGDGALNVPENAEGRRRVIAATSMSIYGVLLAFVEGHRTPTHELAIWRNLPFTIEAPEIRSPLEELLAEIAERPQATGLEPLAAINQPVRRGLSVEAWSFGTGTFTRDRPIVGLLAGIATPVPYWSPLVYGGLGGSMVAERPSERRLTIEAGALRQIGLTNDGVVSHDLIVGVNWRAGLALRRGSVLASYRVTAELGRILVRLQVGPAYQVDEARLGYYGGLALGYLWSARGGGTI